MKKQTHLSQSDLWLINTKKSQKCNPKTLAVDDIVVCHMRPLFEHPFIARIAILNECSAIVDIIKTCDLKDSKALTDHTRSVNLCSVLNVSYKNMLQLDGLVFDEVATKLAVHEKEVDNTKAEQKNHRAKIEKLSRDNERLKQSEINYKDLIRKTDKEVLSLNEAYHESLKWRNTQKSRTLQEKISLLKRQLQKDRDNQEKTAYQINENTKLIKESQVAIGNLNLDIADLEQFIQQIQQLEGFAQRAS